MVWNLRNANYNGKGKQRKQTYFYSRWDTAIHVFNKPKNKSVVKWHSPRISDRNYLDRWQRFFNVAQSFRITLRTLRDTSFVKYDKYRYKKQIMHRGRLNNILFLFPCIFAMPLPAARSSFCLHHQGKGLIWFGDHRLQRPTPIPITNTCGAGCIRKRSGSRGIHSSRDHQALA